MIDVRAFESTRVHTVPFGWSHVRGVLSPEQAAFFAGAFPTHLPNEYERSAGVKALRFRGTLLDGDARKGGAVDAAWFELLDAFASEGFRRVLSTHAGIDLAPARVDGGLWEYGEGSFFGPHTDRESRLLTLLFYLTPGWDPAWGGALAILGSADPGDVHARVVPEFNSCAVVVRRSSSWHAVEPVTSPHARRRVLSVRYFAPEGPTGTEPVLAWREDPDAAIREARALGVGLLVCFERGARAAAFSDAEVIAAIYRRCVPLLVHAGREGELTGPLAAARWLHESVVALDARMEIAGAAGADAGRGAILALVEGLDQRASGR